MAAAKAYSFCLMDRVSMLGIGEGAQAGNQEEGLGEEGGGKDPGGQESFLACQCQGKGA